MSQYGYKGPKVERSFREEPGRDNEKQYQINLDQLRREANKRPKSSHHKIFQAVKTSRLDRFKQNLFAGTGVFIFVSLPTLFLIHPLFLFFKPHEEPTRLLSKDPHEHMTDTLVRHMNLRRWRQKFYTE